jgi:hypothetical protein
MASPARALFLQPHPPEAASAPKRSGARSSVPAALMTKRAPVGGSKHAFESSLFARAPPRPEQVIAPKRRERPDVYSVRRCYTRSRRRERKARKLGLDECTLVTVNAYGCELRYELSRRWHIRLVRNMVENQFCKKIGKINNGKAPKNVALGRRRTRLTRRRTP